MCTKALTIYTSLFRYAHLSKWAKNDYRNARKTRRILTATTTQPNCDAEKKQKQEASVKYFKLERKIRN